MTVEGEDTIHHASAVVEVEEKFPHSQTAADKKKNKKKKKKLHKDFAKTDATVKEEIKEEDKEIVWEADNIVIEEPEFNVFNEIFERFNKLGRKGEVQVDQVVDETQEVKKEEIIIKNVEEMEEEPQEKRKSRKQLKLENRLGVAELKGLVQRPDVVEIHDVTAADPRLLVHLKAYRNTTPVPQHWSQRRKFLQGKRGQEKPAFQLPDFIAATGIQDIRQSFQEKEDLKKLKQKQREKIHPKIGKMDIDYQVLHDAFFKHQTKPKLTKHGDLYYEGKEFEVDMKRQIPGRLSDRLKKALGMPLSDPKIPPPWLINMQRYGPPPSYPNLRIPGVNAPIPEGSRFGFHPGGWGQVPVDQNGRPLYGDVFGQMAPIPTRFHEEVLKEHWGELKEEEFEEEREDEEEDEDEEDHVGRNEGTETPSGYTSNASSFMPGLETPDTMDLRKEQRRELSDPNEEKSLYKVLEQKEVPIGNALFGSSYIYNIPSDKPRGKDKVDLLKSQRTDDIEIAIDESDLDKIDQEEMARRYEEAVKARRDETQREDFSDLIEEQERKKKRKAQAKQAGDKKTKKDEKYKDFKF